MNEQLTILKEVSSNIKKMRIEKGLTLKTLSQKTGFSTGYLSRIENSKIAPNFATLIKIGLALEVMMQDLFFGGGKNKGISVVRKNERRKMAWPGTNHGYEYSALTYGFQQPKMKAAFVSFPDETEEPIWFEHRGEQLAVVFEGKIKFFFGDQEYILEEGDAVYFDCTIPHASVGLGERKAKILTVVYRDV